MNKTNIIYSLLCVIGIPVAYFFGVPLHPGSITAILPALALLVPVVTGIIGSASSAADRARAQEASEKAFQEIQNAGTPPDLSGAVLIKYLEEAGVLTPEMEHEINLGVSKVAGIQEDPATRDASMSALEGLKARGKTGLNAEDRAAYNDIRQRVQGDVEAKRQQIMQNFMARGQGGSGAELAAALSAGQSGADRASAEGDRISADASKRALEAMLAGGQLGATIRGQDFDVAKTKATAEDEIAYRNFQNSVGRQTRNTAARNTAAERNLAEKQRVADYNAQLANAETQRQQAAKRQYWADSAQRARDLANAQMGQAANYQRQGDATAGTWSGIGSGAAAGIGAYANYQNKPVVAAAPLATEAAATPASIYTQADWLKDYQDKQKEDVKYKNTFGGQGQS